MKPTKLPPKGPDLKRKTWKYAKVHEDDRVIQKTRRSIAKADRLAEELKLLERTLSALSDRDRDRILWRINKANGDRMSLRDPDARSVHLSARDLRAWRRAELRVLRPWEWSDPDPGRSY